MSARPSLAEAWHDVTCPEGPECRSRAIHALANPTMIGLVQRAATLAGWQPPSEPLAPAEAAPEDRSPECVRRWAEARDGDYDPRCCRFPKSCSPHPRVDHRPIAACGRRHPGGCALIQGLCVQPESPRL